MFFAGLILTILECGNPIAHDTKVFFFYIYGADVKNGGKIGRLL